MLSVSVQPFQLAKAIAVRRMVESPRNRKRARGPLPIYSDLLVHDMGADLADGIEQGLATGTEFRTQPLWGIVADGPFLHDGRATSLREAILLHAGEGQAARDAAASWSEAQWADLLEFLASLGGRDQASAGLLPPQAPLLATGAYGGPMGDLSADEAALFAAGRALFDRDFGNADGVGAPRLNGDSCRACHFDPVIGGAGPRDVNVMRNGLVSPDGQFLPPTIGTILHRTTRLRGTLNAPQAEAVIFAMRQTPPLFGLGLIDAIDPNVLIQAADPDDLNGDGIRGRGARQRGQAVIQQRLRLRLHGSQQRQRLGIHHADAAAGQDIVELSREHLLPRRAQHAGIEGTHAAQGRQ